MGTTGVVTSENLTFSPGNYSIVATASTTINNKDYKKKTSAGFIVKAINYQGPTIGPAPGPTIGPATGPTPAMLEAQSKLSTLLSKYHPYEYPDGYSISDFTWATEYKQRYEKAVKDALEIQGIFNNIDYLEHLYTSFTDTLNTMGPYPPWMLVAGTAYQFYMRAFVDVSPDISTLPDALGINGYMNKRIAKLSTKRAFFDKTNYKYLVYGGNFLWFKGPRQMFINDINNYENEINKRTDISIAYKNELISYLEVIKNMNINYEQSVSDMNFFLNEIDKEYN